MRAVTRPARNGSVQSPPITADRTPTRRSDQPRSMALFN